MSIESVQPPGDMIRDELKLRSWTQEDLARILDRPIGRVNEIIQGKQGISPDVAASLAAAFGNSPEAWLHAEAAYRLFKANPEMSAVRHRAKMHELAPLKEMQKRGWIVPTDSADGQEKQLLQFFGIPDLDTEPKLHGALRKTAPSVASTPAQRAWAFRVRQIAKAIPADSVGSFDDNRVPLCQAALRKLAAYSKEVRKVPTVLAEFGIRFVAVEGLPGAKVDGFATWLDDHSPVIGMSLRFDHLDSFWFTLGHELIHLKYRDITDIDVDVSGQEDLLRVKLPIERRADEESAATFIKPEELQSFIHRNGPLYSTDKINQFANRIKIHPSIIIGQLKNRGEIKHSQHNKPIVTIREVIVNVAVTDGWGKSINLGGSV